MKLFSTFCAIGALSAALLAVPAMAADCGDNTSVDTGLGAVGGGVLGAGVSRGSAGGVIGGAVIGGLIGNAIGRDNCKDRRLEEQHRDQDNNRDHDPNNQYKAQNNGYENQGPDRRDYGDDGQGRDQYETRQPDRDDPDRR